MLESRPGGGGHQPPQGRDAACAAYAGVTSGYERQATGSKQRAVGNWRLAARAVGNWQLEAKTPTGGLFGAEGTGGRTAGVATGGGGPTRGA